LDGPTPAICEYATTCAVASSLCLGRAQLKLSSKQKWGVKMIALAAETRFMSDVVWTEHTVTLEDGTEVFYRAWSAPVPSRKALIIFHRGHEHSGRLADVVRELRLSDVTVFAWDARGHGRSQGERGFSPSFARLSQDADDFVRHVVQTHGMRLEDIVVLGHSVGAITVASWVHDYAPPIRAMILVTPALRVKLYVPFAEQGLRLISSMFSPRRLYVSSYVKGRLLTHDPEQVRLYDTDPLISRRIAVNVLLGLRDTAKRLMSDAGAIEAPTLLLAGGDDWVVDLNAERRFFERLGSRTKRMRVFEGMYHDILHEQERDRVIDEIRVFVQDAFLGQEPARVAPATGHTDAEFEKLQAPLPLLSLRRLWFALQRLFLKTIGRFSAGIRLGWRYGFDSGASLDYVYENKASGTPPFGWILDRIYLRSPGWAGIRQRKANLQRLLGEAIHRTEERGEAARILDVAAGRGSYVLETMAATLDPKASAVLRDHSPANLAAIREVTARLDLRNVEVQQADAFSTASYRSIENKPNIAIVAGLFELFPDNRMLRRCLAGIAAVLEEGGYLLYTGQPWHPQLEMIGRVLTNREGERWVMRCRSQLELDDLIREFGFEKLRSLTDERGIFTVSLAGKL
jgi:alpha-beta hydrolase superfamily lysophospholipase/SAM-dependent methyltransferase